MWATKCCRSSSRARVAERRLRIGLIICAALAILVVVAPILIGAVTRDAITAEPLVLAPGLGLKFSDAGDTSWPARYRSQLDVTLIGGLDIVTGRIELAHNPLILLSASSLSDGYAWPGLIDGTFKLNIEADAIAAFYQVAGEYIELTGKVRAAGTQFALAAELPAGSIRTPWRIVELQHGKLASTTSITDPLAPVSFDASLSSELGEVTASGQIFRARPGFSVQLSTRRAFVDALAEAHLRNLLGASTQASAEQLKSLAERRVNSLMQLGYLHRTADGVTAEVAWTLAGLRVNGLAVN